MMGRLKKKKETKLCEMTMALRQWQCYPRFEVTPIGARDSTLQKKTATDEKEVTLNRNIAASVDLANMRRMHSTRRERRTRRERTKDMRTTSVCHTSHGRNRNTEERCKD